MLSATEHEKLLKLEKKEKDFADLYFAWPSEIKLQNYNKATKDVRDFRKKHALDENERLHL